MINLKMLIDSPEKKKSDKEYHECKEYPDLNRITSLQILDNSSNVDTPKVIEKERDGFLNFLGIIIILLF